MKIRNGFVSNSSSSSFIVPVDNNLTERDLYAKILDIYPVEDYITHEIFDIHIEPKDLANVIFRDISIVIDNDRENNLNSLENDMENLVMTRDGFDDIIWSDETRSLGLKERLRKYGEMHEKARKIAETDLVMMEKDNKGKTLVSLEYGDNDSNVSGFLEHSGIIEKLFPGTIRISYH